MVEGHGRKVLFTFSIQEAENSNKKGPQLGYTCQRHDHSNTFHLTRLHLVPPSHSFFSDFEFISELLDY